MPRLCPRCQTRYAAADVCAHDATPLVEDRTSEVFANSVRLERLIGLGGMGGAVWSGRMIATGEAVATKVVNPASEKDAMRFLRGAELAALIDSPHVTRVHQWGELQDGALFLVMERLHGRTLSSLLQQGVLSVSRTVAVARQLLFALEALDQYGSIVHRDLKPGNIFVSQARDGRWHVRLLDFGIARRASQPAAESVCGAGFGTGRITLSGDVCGTPEYMAPEQIIGSDLDGRADLYSLGVTLYRALSGSLPFRAADRIGWYRAHAFLEPPAVSAPPSRGRIPEALVAFIKRLLSKHPDDRFSSATEAAAVLTGLSPTKASIDGSYAVSR